MRLTLLLSSILLLFVNCDCTKSVNENKENNLAPPLGDNYLIELINDQDVKSKGLTINFDKLTNNVSGNAGCNEYFGRFQQEDKNIFFSKVSATKKYCGNAEIRILEKQLLNLLPSIKSMDSNKSGNINFYNEQSILLMSITNLNK